MARIQVINGPNLNLLGRRETHFYGTRSLADIEQALRAQFEPDHELRFVQSNVEGFIVDALHAAQAWADGIVINPGAYTHYSYAIHDAVKAVAVPTLEVHISHIHARDEFRRTSVIAPACIGQISGCGWYGYVLATTVLVRAAASA